MCTITLLSRSLTTIMACKEIMSTVQFLYMISKMDWVWLPVGRSHNNEIVKVHLQREESRGYFVWSECRRVHEFLFQTNPMNLELTWRSCVRYVGWRDLKIWVCKLLMHQVLLENCYFLSMLFSAPCLNPCKYVLSCT